MTEPFEKSVLTRAAVLYGFDAKEAVKLPSHEGGRNTVYRAGDRIMRISSLEDRTREDYLAETEYVHYLARGGASVADVYPSANGNLVEVIVRGNEKCAVSLFALARGDQIESHGYRYRDGAPLEEYFFNCGKTLGKMHALSVSYRPAHPRFDFFGKYNEAYFDSLIPDELTCPFLGTEPIGRAVREKLHALLERLRALPRKAETRGMIHFDFSDGNYNIDYSDGTITVFDFDNCRVGPYLFDLANLWSHGVGWTAWNGNADERRKFMEHYMETVISGYRTEMTITDETLSSLPLLVDAVRMENIIDEFEVRLKEDGVLSCDGEQAYRLKGLLADVPFMGFFDDDFDPECPFDLDTE